MANWRMTLPPTCHETDANLLIHLEHLDFVVDSKNQKLIPNLEHGDQQMSEEY